METDGMARRSKHEYLRTIHPRYRQAKRAEKTMMLDEFTQVCGYNRKYALWLLNRPLPARSVSGHAIIPRCGH
jgi:hypothetical protein